MNVLQNLKKKVNKHLHLWSVKTWNMYDARVISLNLFPTPSNAEGVQIDSTLMNELFIYNKIPLFLFFAISNNNKVVI